MKARGLFDYFGITEDARISEVRESYKRIQQKYADKVFLGGGEGSRAATELSLLEENYRDIKVLICNRDFNESNAEIRDMVKAASASEDTQRIQEYLDTIIKKDGYWHYIQSVIFYIKRLYFESAKHLRMALTLDPDNKKYRETLFKLEEKIIIRSEEVMSVNSEEPEE